MTLTLAATQWVDPIHGGNLASRRQIDAGPAWDHTPFAMLNDLRGRERHASRLRHEDTP
jgi:hypothetical protein